MNCSYSRPISGLSGGVPPDPPRRPPVRPPGRPAGKFPEIRGGGNFRPPGGPPGGPPGTPLGPPLGPPSGDPLLGPSGGPSGGPSRDARGVVTPLEPPGVRGDDSIPQGPLDQGRWLSWGSGRDPLLCRMRKSGRKSPPTPPGLCTAGAPEEGGTTDEEQKRRCEDHLRRTMEGAQIWDGTGPPGGYHPPRTPLS